MLNQRRLLFTAMARADATGRIKRGAINISQGITKLMVFQFQTASKPVHRVTITHSVKANVAWWISWSKPIVAKKRCQSCFAQSLDDMRLVM